jgi:heme exporter protein CcmD
MDFNSFINMGGYGLNVWGAYGLAFAVYTGVMVHAVIKLDRLKKTESKKLAKKS